MDIPIEYIFYPVSNTRIRVHICVLCQPVYRDLVTRYEWTESIRSGYLFTICKFDHMMQRVFLGFIPRLSQLNIDSLFRTSICFLYTLMKVLVNVTVKCRTAIRGGFTCVNSLEDHVHLHPYLINSYYLITVKGSLRIEYNSNNGKKNQIGQRNIFRSNNIRFGS